MIWGRELGGGGWRGRIRRGIAGGAVPKCVEKPAPEEIPLGRWRRGWVTAAKAVLLGRRPVRLGADSRRSHDRAGGRNPAADPVADDPQAAALDRDRRD